MIITAPKFDWAYVSATGCIPEGMQFIRDTMPLKVVEQKIITESVGGNKSYVLKLTGIFQRADVRNANGRIYPYDVLKGAVGGLQEAIKGRRTLGEFDHPPDAKIHLDRVSHLITNLWMDRDGVVYGELEVLNDSRMPCGAMLSCLVERKIQVGISSRGVGDMEMTVHEGEEAYRVADGYNFVTFDVVAEPSVTGTQLMVMESLQKKNKITVERELLREVHNFFN